MFVMPQSRPLDPEIGLATPRVLLAEDDPGMRDLLARILADSGYDVVQAIDGQELLDLVSSALASTPAMEPFDIIVTDVRMPSHTGMDALKLMRSAHVRTPVIVITAFGDEELHRAAYELGAWVLDKPFDLEDFEEAVAAMVRRRQRAAGRALLMV
jgi:DNA-binding response OmpR family regulator